MGGGGSGERRQSVGLVSKVGGGFYCCASFSRASQAGISRLWELMMWSFRAAFGQKGGGFYCCASFSRASQEGISRLWELDYWFWEL